MKKRKIARKTAYSIIAGATLASAAFLPGCNRPETVYGPPPEFYTQQNADPDETGTEIISETASFDPEENDPVEVYGPPEYFDPEYNIEEDVYGPPPES